MSVCAYTCMGYYCMELNCGPLRNQPLGRLKRFIIDESAVYWVLVKLSNRLDARIRTMFGMETSIKDFLSVRRLRWLGHTARMGDDRIPKKLLSGWLPQIQPVHGAKLRWRDKVRQDL